MKEQGSALILLIAGIFMLVILVVIASLYLSRISLIGNTGNSEEGGSVNVTTAIDQAGSIATKADLKAMQVALEVYFAENGSYPNSLQELSSGGYLNEGTDLDSYTYQLCGSTKALLYTNSKPYQGISVDVNGSQNLQGDNPPSCD
jgi:hypothetical protein